MGEAAIIAVCAAMTAWAKVAELAIQGQTMEQRAVLWQKYIDDLTAWRKFWGLEK
jgi:hypothetical protein